MKRPCKYVVNCASVVAKCLDSHSSGVDRDMICEASMEW